MKPLYSNYNVNLAPTALPQLKHLLTLSCNALPMLMRGTSCLMPFSKHVLRKLPRSSPYHKTKLGGSFYQMVSWIMLIHLLQWHPLLWQLGSYGIPPSQGARPMEATLWCRAFMMGLIGAVYAGRHTWVCLGPPSLWIIISWGYPFHNGGQTYWPTGLFGGFARKAQLECIYLLQGINHGGEGYAM